ncbi:MAG: hypothetical protein WAU58_14160 [Terriglobales bacterium]
MLLNIWKANLLLAAAAMALPAFAQSVTHPQTKAKLVGTWQVQVTQVDCTSGDPLGPPFTSLLTFAAGGTMNEDTSNPAFGRGQRGGGQGMWSSTGPLTYEAKSVAFIKYTTAPNPKTHNPGFEAGLQTISQNITLGESGQWSSNASVVFTDTSGNTYRQGCAVANATTF